METPTRIENSQESFEGSFFSHLSEEQRLFIGEKHLAAVDAFISRFSKEQNSTFETERRMSATLDIETYRGSEAERINTLDKCIEQMINPSNELRRLLFKHALNEKSFGGATKIITNTLEDGKELAVTFCFGIPSYVKLYEKNREKDSPDCLFKKEIFTEDELFESFVPKDEWYGPVSLVPEENIVLGLKNEALLRLKDDYLGDHINQIMGSEGYDKNVRFFTSRFSETQQRHYEEIRKYLEECKFKNENHLPAFRLLQIPDDKSYLDKYFGIGTSFTIRTDTSQFSAGMAQGSGFPIILGCELPLDSIYLPDIPYTAQWDYNAEQELRVVPQRPVLLTSITFLGQGIPSKIPSLLKGSSILDPQSQIDAVNGLVQQNNQKNAKAIEFFEKARIGITDGRICETVTFEEPITLYC